MIKRQLIKRKPGSLKKSGKIKAKKKTPEQMEEQQKQYEADWVFYDSLWNNYKEKKCEQCSCIIYGENKNLYHHHLLEKSVTKYKHLRYEKDNLMLLCSQCHINVTNGFPGDKVIERTNKAKETFGFI